MFIQRLPTDPATKIENLPDLNAGAYGPDGQIRQIFTKEPSRTRKYLTQPQKTTQSNVTPTPPTMATAAPNTPMMQVPVNNSLTYQCQATSVTPDGQMVNLLATYQPQPLPNQPNHMPAQTNLQLIRPIDHSR